MSKNLIYDIHDRPQTGKLIVFSLQQLLAIMAATIAVPAQVGYGMSASAALFGAGAGTLIYQIFTKFRSPVFLGSSFAFIPSMIAAFAGAATVAVGYIGLIIGAFMAGLVYVALALAVKLGGVSWVGKLMPAVVIGPTVALIGLSLSSAAVSGMFSYTDPVSGSYVMNAGLWVSFACAIVTMLIVMLCSTFGKKMTKLVPFVIGVAAGYLVALVLTLIGYATGADALKAINFDHFRALVDGGVSVETFLTLPDFTFLEAFGGFKDLTVGYFLEIFGIYVPVAFVVFAEHIADHKNLSNIIGEDLLENPGLHRTLLGDGVGSMVGAFFGGCPNTTYGESVGCVAITRNASVVTISLTAVIAMAISFVSPFVALLSSIPSCVMGGVCVTLYGFIAVSGLKMIQKVDLEDRANLFTISAILIPGIGCMSLKIGGVVITAIAASLVLGIIVNTILHRKNS